MLALAALAGCAGLAALIEKPTAEVAGLRIERLTLTDPQVVLILRLRNPNPISLPLESLSVQLELNDRPFAEGGTSAAVTLPARQSALTELVLHARTDLLWRTVQEMLHSPGGTLRYRLRGQAEVSSLRLHIDFDTPGETDLDTLFGRHKPATPGH